MSRDFAPHLEILPLPQRRLWDELSAVPREFVLYGGTAIALHLGHRQSIDFDFFGSHAFQPRQLTDAMAFLKEGRVTQQEPDTLSAEIDRGGNVKVSFFGLPGFVQVAPTPIAADNGLQVASLLDLAGTKVAVVQQRAEAKDYLDIDAILTDGRIDLSTALAAAKAIYGSSFDPQISLKALSFFGDGNLASLQAKVRDRLAKAARDVDLDKLPVINPLTRHANPGDGTQ